MIEIFILTIILVMMAKNGRRSPYRNTNWKKQMGRYIRGNVDLDMALGTLNPKTLTAQAVSQTVTERTFLSSVVLLWSLIGKTVADNQGPIMVGIAHSDYTAAEIEAWIENQASWAEADLIGREINRRKIRRVGVFNEDVSLATQVLNQGQPQYTKCNWILNAGQTIDIWAYNNGSVALATTDPNVVVSGHANLWPR